MSCILAIDDRPLNRQFLVSLLGYGGHKILEASDGEEGLGVIRESHPDLVITDIKMPNMDGYQFVESLRKQEDTAKTPVIFYTASYHEHEARSVADLYGVADVITKPSEPEIILKKVNAVLATIAESGGSQRSTSDASSRSELELLQNTGLRMSALIELGMELGMERDIEPLLSRFCSAARHIVGARKSMLGIPSDDGNWLKHFVINGLREAHPIVGERPPVDHPALETIIRERKPVRINHADVHLHLEELSPHNSPIKSFLGVPLMSSVGVYGWLVLLEKQNDAEFSDEDEKIATTLAAQAAIAYENVLFSGLLQRNAQQFERLRREQLELKDQFLSHVSHELRSPLTAVHQFTTIILDGLAGEINTAQREYLGIILRNALQLRDMIGDLLEASRAQGGKLTCQREPLSLWDLLDSLVQTFQPRAAEKSIQLRTSRIIENPVVFADSIRIRQVLTNLVDNALKFTGQGEICVSCSPDEDPSFLRIAVSDTGCGIKASSLPYVFDRLYQSPDTLEASRRGLGLGMYICKQIIQLHQGRIWIESKEGEGTTVFFTLPLHAS